MIVRQDLGNVLIRPRLIRHMYAFELDIPASVKWA